MKLQLSKHLCHKCRRDNRFIPIRDIIILLLHHHFLAVAEDAAVVEEVAEEEDTAAEDMVGTITIKVTTTHPSNSSSNNNKFNSNCHSNNRINLIVQNTVQPMEHVATIVGNVVIQEKGINGKQLSLTKWVVPHGIVTPDY